jgi:NADH-quinone oxidoreductase subunit N
MERVNYFSIVRWVVPELILAVVSLVALIADLFAMRELTAKIRRVILGMIGCAGCGAAIIWILIAPGAVRLAQGSLVVNQVSAVLSISILVLTFCAVVIFVDTSFTDHISEYIAVLLLAAIGMLFLVSSENLLVIFLSFELTSLSLYALAAFDKKNVASTEAALKYFLFGGISAAFTLFGISLLYGMTGTLYLPEIASAMKSKGMDSLLALSLVMTVAGFGFKIAAVPFHFWAPDVYEGSPAPTAAIVASGSKIAGFFIFARVLLSGFQGVEGSAAWACWRAGWLPVIGTIAVASMLLGNLAAIVQSRFRRLIAYSAIAHSGYALLGVMGYNGPGLAALTYYIITYGITLTGIFGVIAIIEARKGNDAIINLAGLGRSSPVLAFCLLTFMLSLAGVPPFAGFIGKFYLVTSVLGKGAPMGNFWLVLAAIALSVVSLYYYLQVLKQVYVAPAPLDQIPYGRSWFAGGVVCLAAGLVILFGVFPGLLLHPIIMGLRAL